MGEKICKTSVGGQAIIEGVMMRGPKGIAMAVRKADGEIVLESSEPPAAAKKHKMLKWPVVRGVFAFIDSLVVGVKALMWSAEFFDIEDEEQEPTKFDLFLDKVFGDKLKDAIIYFSVFISLIAGVGIFMILPTVIVGFMRGSIESAVVKTIIEGLVRIAIFLCYIILISRMRDIQRVFEYHGAEHKTIFTYEKGDELTAENARKNSRFHPRCGTSFLLIVMVISIIAFSFLRWENVWIRMLMRLALLPLIAGVSYEVIKWAGRSDSRIVSAVSAPGLWLQRMTTREPDDEQIEVAIAALKAVITGNRDDDKW